MDEAGVMQPVVQMRDVWTVEDLGELAVGDRRRYQILDGALVVSPPSAARHEVAAEELRAAVRPAIGPELIILSPFGVRIETSYFVPDLVVTARAGLRDKVLLAPAEVVLAVEVVSPGSITMDRVTKPARYAAAGIPAYWRVETDPVSLTAYTLPPGDGTYVEVGSWRPGETAQLTVPFSVIVDIDRLVAS